MGVGFAPRCSAGCRSPNGPTPADCVHPYSSRCMRQDARHRTPVNENAPPPGVVAAIAAPDAAGRFRLELRPLPTIAAVRRRRCVGGLRPCARARGIGVAEHGRRTLPPVRRTRPDVRRGVGEHGRLSGRRLRHGRRHRRHATRDRPRPRRRRVSLQPRRCSRTCRGYVTRRRSLRGVPSPRAP